MARFRRLLIVTVTVIAIATAEGRETGGTVTMMRGAEAAITTEEGRETTGTTGATTGGTTAHDRATTTGAAIAAAHATGTMTGGGGGTDVPSRFCIALQFGLNRP